AVLETTPTFARAPEPAAATHSEPQPAAHVAEPIALSLVPDEPAAAAPEQRLVEATPAGDLTVEAATLGAESEKQWAADIGAVASEFDSLPTREEHPASAEA